VHLHDFSSWQSHDQAVDLDHAAARWTAALARWAIPDAILADAPESPWTLPPADFQVAASGPIETASAPREREVVPPGGTVLDVGCGGGRACLALVPPAAHVVGVDESPAMLEQLTAAAQARGVGVECFAGRWPDVSAAVPPGDVVVCHHVVYNVPDIVAFLRALTAHARRSVVVELTAAHPQSTWNAAWRHFWDLARPDEPVADDLIAVVCALGWTPETWCSEIADDGPLGDRHRAVRATRRRLCLPASRDVEIAAFLAEHPLPWPRDVVTVRWSGGAHSA
jgi:SAM-dependent methyltransferase